ncbi:MAG: tetratricopeptide repeat protein [Candidatus Competibacteraceae bacterium]|nr:tetratricopeptide repeat protein [Candidatus Competibacteraceae bacterium]
MRKLAVLLFCAVLSGCAILNRDDNGSVDVAEQARRAHSEGRFSDAEYYYQALTRAYPETLDPWFQLGNLYAENNRLEDAQQAYRQALKYGDNPKVLHNLGLVQLQQGIATLQQARRQLPADDPIHDHTRQYLQLLLEEGL